MDLRDIKAIIDLMKKNSISEFELEKQDFKVRLKRGPHGVVSTLGHEDVSMLPAPSPHSALPINVSAGSQSGTTPAPNDQEIKSPMIGTFYRAPSPDSVPYVEVGTEVSADSVICIIEAMKVMNEIKAEVAGVVTKILVDNAKPVEFGQPLFQLKPGTA